MRWAVISGVLVALVFLAAPAWAKKPSPTPVPTPTSTPTVTPSATESPSPLPSDSPSPSDTPSPTDPPAPSPTAPATSSSSVPPTLHQPPGNDQAAGPSLPNDTPAGFGGFPAGFRKSASPAEPSPTPAESISVDDPASQPSPVQPSVPSDVLVDQADVGFVAMFLGLGVLVFAVAAFAGWHSRHDGEPQQDT